MYHGDANRVIGRNEPRLRSGAGPDPDRINGERDGKEREDHREGPGSDITAGGRR